MVKTGNKDVVEKEKKSKKIKQKPTVKEAILAYQINIRERSLDDAQFELRLLQEENRKKRALNESIKKEQERMIKDLIISTKSIVNEKLDKTFVSRENVVEALNQNWQITETYEEELVKINENIRNVEVQIEEEKKKFEFWKDYEDRGQLVAKNKIQLLQQELEDREATFQTMTGEMVKNLKKAKETIEEITADTLAQQKSLAIKKAVSKMERFTRQDVVDNMWLHNQLEKCRKDTRDLLETLEKLEAENLQLLSSLYKCKIEDLQITRQKFAEKIDTEDLTLSNLMEIDLSKLSFHLK